MTKSTHPEIIFEDSSLLVINKPPNLLSIPARYDVSLPNAKTLLELAYGPLLVVHRLDKQTSGALMLAKSAESHKALSLLFQNKQIDKKYLALCFGTPSNKEAKIDLAIREMANKRGKYQVHPSGKDALSIYRVIEEFKHYSLLEVDLITGRTHQIRVHLKGIGTPLLVDSFYGHSTSFYLSEIKGRKYNSSKQTEEQPLFSRSSLHAHELKFIHPFTQKDIEIVAGLPKDFRACLNQLRKWDKRI